MKCITKSTLLSLFSWSLEKLRHPHTRECGKTARGEAVVGPQEFPHTRVVIAPLDGFPGVADGRAVEFKTLGVPLAQACEIQPGNQLVRSLEQRLIVGVEGADLPVGVQQCCFEPLAGLICGGAVETVVPGAAS